MDSTENHHFPHGFPMDVGPPKGPGDAPILRPLPAGDPIARQQGEDQVIGSAAGDFWEET